MTIVTSHSEHGLLTGTIKEVPKYHGRRDADALDAQMEKVYDPRTDAWLSSIYVDAQSHEKGEGSMLLEQFEQDCREDGVRRIVGVFSPDVMTAGNLEAALEFYASHSYTLYVSERNPDTAYVIKDL